jgi:hypothetical protein
LKYYAHILAFGEFRKRGCFVYVVIFVSPLLFDPAK